MHRPHLRRSSVVTVVAAAALVVATGGTSTYAAHLITSKQIKNNTIKSIDVRNGTLTPADMAPGTIPAPPAPYAGTSAYSTFHDAGVSIQNQASGQDPTVLSLSVPAGSYVFNATTWLNNGASNLLARCTLSAGGDNDVKRQFLEQSGTGAYAASVSLQVVHTFGAPGSATFTCYGFGVNATANNSKITAIKVDHLTNTAG
jgi:hypothetical protein